MGRYGEDGTNCMVGVQVEVNGNWERGNSTPKSMDLCLFVQFTSGVQCLYIYVPLQLVPFLVRNGSLSDVGEECPHLGVLSQTGKQGV